MEEGASLVYREDENYTYADLKSGSDKDLTSFKEFIKNLNDVPYGEKGDIESFLDVDSALIYIASNTVLCNYDSYNNSMKHNYYLYENGNGVFSVIPWDMNMSFGGRESNTNVGIDTPLVSGTMESSPLISKLLAAPAIIEDSTMVPVRFVSEQLGMTVTWNGGTKLITITSK